MAQHRNVWPVRWMGQALEVSASGFYEWMGRPESVRAQANRVVLARIRESFEASDRTYGSPRVWRDLRAGNVACGENRTARLMHQAGLRARPAPRRLPLDTGARSSVAPNALDRQFAAAPPNQKWVADFTYLWTGEGWLYVAVVLDLFFKADRRLVAAAADDRTARHRRQGDSRVAPAPETCGAAAPF